LDIKEYFRIFRRFWWIILVTALIGGGLGYATSLSAISKYLPSFFSNDYVSTATLFVATQNGASVAEAYQNNLFSEERVVSYAALASSEQVAARAIDQLKAPLSVGELRSKITAIPEPKTVLLDISVKDADPAQAQTYANAVADSLVGLVAELETSRRGGSPAAGAIVVDDANYPTDPGGLGLATRIGLGVVAGLLLGLIIAVILGVVDKRLRGRETVESASDAAVLGGLPVDSSRPHYDVIDLAAGGLYAERLRELRTNLRFATGTNGGGQPRVIAVTSPSGEEGRTTVAIDLAAAIAETGRSVVLVDGSLRNAALTERLPMSDRLRKAAAERGLSTALAGEHDVSAALIPAVKAGEHSIAVLPAGPRVSRPGELWATDRAQAVLDRLRQDFDYVVIDTPPIDAYYDAVAVAALSDGAIVLARIRQTTATALRRALQKLSAADVEVIGTVVTFEPVGALAKRRHGRQTSRDDATTGSGTDQATSGRAAADTGAGDGDTQIIPAVNEGLVGSGSPTRRARRAPSEESQ
jgi:capsular exopolysaccharide synthesis family protein